MVDMYSSSVRDICVNEVYSCTLAELLKRAFGESETDSLAVPGELDASSLVIEGVAVDSSAVQSGYIFVAIPGYQKHGAQYSQDALQRNASVIVTDTSGKALIRKIDTQIPVILTDNPRKCAALLSAAFYGFPSKGFPLIGITGTNGKTTTSYMLRNMLGNEDECFVSGTVETKVGAECVSSSCTTLNAADLQRVLAVAKEKQLKYGIMEVSSHALDQYRVTGTRFRAAVFTNLSAEHLDYHRDMENYYQAKKKLFTKSFSDYAVICVDDEWGRRLAQESEIAHTRVAVLTNQAEQLYRDGKTDWYVSSIENDVQKLRIKMTLHGPHNQVFDLTVGLLGRVNAQNAALAFVTALALGVDPMIACERLSKRQYVPGRMVVLGGKSDNLPLVIVDFAHTPDAIQQLFNTVKGMDVSRIHVIASHDGERQQEHRFEIGRLCGAVDGKIWVTDSNPRYESSGKIRAQIIAGIKEIRPELNEVYEVTTWRTDAVREAILGADPGDAVVIFQKGEEPYQEICGVKHYYNDSEVVREVLAAYRKAKR